MTTQKMQPAKSSPFRANLAAAVLYLGFAASLAGFVALLLFQWGALLVCSALWVGSVIAHGVLTRE